MTISDASAERLVKLYSKAEKEILTATNKALLRGNSTRNLDAMLVRVKAIRKDLLAGARTWTDAAIPAAYEAGMESTGLRAVAGGAIHQHAMQILADNVYGRFEQVDQVIGRKVADIYRSVALENITGDVAGYETWKQAAKGIREDLADRGITGFVDKAGKNWNMETYADMVARTTPREAMREGTKNRLLEHGYDLAEVTGGASEKTCEHCAAWVGEVFSLTGKTEGYITLDEIEAGAMPDGSQAEHPHLFGPNCTHNFAVAGSFEEAIAEAEGEE